MAKLRFVLFYISLFASGKENWLLNIQIYFSPWFLSSSPYFLFILCLLYSCTFSLLFWHLKILILSLLTSSMNNLCLMHFVKKFLKSNHVMLPTGEVTHLSIHISLLIRMEGKLFKMLLQFWLIFYYEDFNYSSKLLAYQISSSL